MGKLSTSRSSSCNMSIICKLYIHVAYLLHISWYICKTWTLLCTCVREKKWVFEGDKKCDTVSYLHHAQQSAAAEHMLWHQLACIHDRWWWHELSLLCAVRRWTNVKTVYSGKWSVITFVHVSHQQILQIKIGSRRFMSLYVYYVPAKYEMCYEIIASCKSNVVSWFRGPIFSLLLHRTLAWQQLHVCQQYRIKAYTHVYVWCE
jgi:hypothetical protein